jgi:hypothetical protein
VHTPIAPEMKHGGASSSRTRLPYKDVRKFQHDRSNAGKISKTLWKILQELGYEKQLRYYGTQVTYEGSEPVWHVQVYIFTHKVYIAPRCTFYAGIWDAACLAYMVTRSCHRQLLDGMEYAHFYCYPAVPTKTCETWVYVGGRA